MFVEEQELRRRRGRPTGDEEADLEAFQKRHRGLSDRVERVLMQLVILGLAALALVQTLEMSPAVRRMANLTEGIDGVAVSDEKAWAAVWNQPAVSASSQTGTTGGNQASGQAGSAVSNPAAGTYTVSVVLMTAPSAPDVSLLVAGRKVATFREVRVDVPVRPGQLLEIDATGHAGALSFRVVKTGGLTTPEPGLQVEAHGNRISLGVARRAN